MKISRLDLDGAGSPAALVARILEVEPDLPIPVPIEALCEQLDITSIGELHTEGFAAALVTDAVRSTGAILVAVGQDRRRRRFSIGHELGHFLIESHRLPDDGVLRCSAQQMRLDDTKAEDTRRRMEAEANRFAALLLMPVPRLRSELRAILTPAITDIVRLADLFDVSKEALARAYVDYTRKTVAIIVVSKGRVIRSYRRKDFPWIAVSSKQAVPADSLFHDRQWLPGDTSDPEECDAETWLDEHASRQVERLTEQLLAQRDHYAMIMLHAELRDEDDD